MAISASSLKIYGSASMPEDDVSTSGGTIDTTCAVLDMPQAGATVPKAKSSSGADTTQTVTITGRLATGAIVTDPAVTLNGTTAVVFTSSFERILKVVKSASTTGIVTIYMQDGTTAIVALAPTVTKNRRLFYDSASGPAQTIRYVKVWAKNEDGALTLNAAKAKIPVTTGDPAGKLRMGLATAANQSVATRLTAPSPTVTWVDDNVDLDLTSIAAGATKEIWVEATLAADNAPIKNVLIITLSGTSA